VFVSIQFLFLLKKLSAPLTTFEKDFLFFLGLEVIPGSFTSFHLFSLILLLSYNGLTAFEEEFFSAFQGLKANLGSISRYNLFSLTLLLLRCNGSPL
jgi:hypothetical protein